MATAIWGGAFLVTHRAVAPDLEASVPPLIFVALRFATASAIITALTRPRLLGITRTELRAGAFISLAMFGGYALQATAMRTIASGRAAFLCALYVPIVPLLLIAIQRRLPRPAIWLSLALACAGLLLMAGPFGSASFGRGDALALTSALAIAAEIILVTRYAPRAEPRRLAIIECLYVAALCAVLALASGETFPAPHLSWIASAVGLGAASAFLQVVVNWCLRTVPANRATVIYALEPVWAGLFGTLAGEHMGLPALAGASLILASLLVGTLTRQGRRRALPVDPVTR